MYSTGISMLLPMYFRKYVCSFVRTKVFHSISVHMYACLYLCIIHIGAGFLGVPAVPLKEPV